MSAHGFALFETAIGWCGVAWSAAGIAGLVLPESDPEKTRALLARRHPGARQGPPPPAVESALDAIRALLRGEPRSLDTIVLDLSDISPFYRRVYDAARSIRPGATLSYGDIAVRIGSPGSARAVGQALGKNPFPIVVPCHRVLGANGKTGGFSAYGGTATKLRLLSIEGARPAAQRSLFDGDAAFAFDPAEAVRHLRERDASLAVLIDAVGPFRMQLKKTASVFAALSEAIVYQQLTGKAAATIYARVCALFPTAHGPTARHVLEQSARRLRGAGLSRAKVLALKDLAARTERGELPTFAEMDSMHDDAIIERLTAVRGIGRWTVEMMLMFRLGRPDVLPLDDYGIRKGFAVAFRKRTLPGKADLEKCGAKWRPYRTVASWYLWRALDGDFGG